MYTASTEYWTISKIRYKEKKTELKCLMAYLYTFTNSQQKKVASYTSILYADNPDAHRCKHTCLDDAYTYGHITE